MKPATTKIFFPEPTLGPASPVKVLNEKERKAVEADLIRRGLLNPVKAKAPKLYTSFKPSKTKTKAKTTAKKKGRPRKS